MLKRKIGCGFNRNKYVVISKNLIFKVIGFFDNYVLL